MASRIKVVNLVLGTIIFASVVGIGYEGYQFQKIQNLNAKLDAGSVITSEAFPFQSKFSSAYSQATRLDYKHAVQTYGQLLDANTHNGNLTDKDLSLIQFNIGNSLFRAGMSRMVNDDGSLREESVYSFSQARIAYEQSLRLNPTFRVAKFNLSLLNSIIPSNMKSGVKDQSAVELSNLPVGLP